MRKFLRILLFALVLTSTFSSLFDAPAAHALDTSYSWADEANILNSRDYRYSKLGTANTDGTYDYVRTQDTNVCIESITVRKTNHARGVLHHNGKKNDKGVCEYTDTNIDIGDIANYDIPANTGKDHDGKPITEFENNHKHGSDCGGSFFSALKLVICPVLTDINKVIQWTFDNIIKPFLKVTPLDTNSDLYKSWSAIRSVTNVFFVLVFLFIIFGNAFGIGVDAYTFKKALPRLALAVVAVQASFFICGIAVDIGNVLGDGVAGLLNVAANSATPSNAASSGATALAGSIGIGAGVAASVVLGFASAAWPFILLAFLGFLVAMVIFIIILCARTLIIYLLILVSPLAFLAWVLPSTSPYFKKWKDNFVKIIAMYPLVVGLLAVAQLISRTSTNIANQGGLGTNFVAAIMALFAPMIAMFMMPRTFKWGGDLIGKAAEAISKQGQKVQNKVGEMKDRAKGTMLEKNARKLEKLGPASGMIRDANGKLLRNPMAIGKGLKSLGALGLARVASGNTFSYGESGRRKIASQTAEARRKLAADNEAALVGSGTNKNAPLFDALLAYKKGAKTWTNPETGRTLRLNSDLAEAIQSKIAAQGGAVELGKYYDGIRDSVTGQFIAKDGMGVGTGRFDKNGKEIKITTNRQEAEWAGIYDHTTKKFVSAEDQEQWQRGVSTPYGGNLVKSLRHTIHGAGDGSLATASGEEVASLHGVTAPVYEQEVIINGSQQDKQRAINALVNVGQSADRRGRIAPQILNAFKKNEAEFASTMVQIPGEATPITGQEFINRYLSITDVDTGTIGAVPES